MVERNPSLWRPAPSLNAEAFENEILTLHDLFTANARLTGQTVVRGRQFRNCRIEGPAVLLIHADVTIDGCNLGEAFGDVRNLVFKPMGELAIGPIPVADCRFEACSFFAVGFTGSDAVLERLVGALPERSQ